MKVKHALSIVSILAVFAFGATSVMAAATSLPFADGFESGFTGDDDPWSTNSSGDHIVAANAGAALAGSLGLQVSNATVTLDIADGVYTRAWLQVYANPVTGTDDPSVSSVNGAFYLKSDGTLRAYTGSWVQVESGIPTGQYLGFTIYADYVADQWCLYHSDGTYSTNMTLADDAGGPLEFATAGATHIQNFSFESGDNASFDGIGASPGFLSLGDCSSFVQAIEVSGNNIQEFELPVYPAAYTNTPQDLVNNRAGDDLRTGMFNNDKLIFLTHDNPSASSDGYILAAGIWDEDPGVLGTEAVSTKELLLSSRLQIDLTLSAGASRWIFIPYDNALAFQGTATGVAAGHQEVIVINGTDVNSGFTALEWLESEVNVNALGFAAGNPDSGGLDHGDRLYVQANNGSSWKTYWWHDTDNAWQDGGSTASAAVPAGSRCWVQRLGSGGGRNFTITH